MPSLFERVGRSLTRKKPEIVTSGKDSARTTLEGFEQVSPNDVKGYVPTESKSPVTEKTPGVFQAFLRSKSPSRADPARYDRAPHLSLHLPDLSEGGSSIKEKLSIVFEPAPDPTYTDEVIAAKRLTTSETLALVQKTASVITQRGLETPGIFKSFWYAQSPQTQRKLVVLFLQTLSVKAAPASDEPKPDPAIQAFDDQLKYASPHDVAELFKWAIRHFTLGAPSFGTSPDEYGWYKNFAESEQAANYPPDAYTAILGPLLPPNHLELLNTIFNFASSVASYAELNGVSGSRFSRAIGWWLLSERQPSTNGLVGFIHDWDTAARILEHLFLAYVRDQQRLGLMPKRLTQLVKSYPYPKQAAPSDQYFLPRPKFTTQQRTALFVRAAVPSHSKDHYNGKPLQLLRDALGAPIDEGVSDAEYRSLWEEVKKHATEAVTQPNSPTSPVEGSSVAPMISISGVLTETAVRTLTNAGGESTVTSPTRPIDSLPESPLWRSVSPTRRTTDGGFSTTNSTALTSPVDWEEFTGQGFGGLSGANSLTFSEFAPTPPRQSSTVGANARSTTSKKQRTARRRSVDFKTPLSNGHTAEPAFPTKDESGIVSETTEGTLGLDEAFIDNWAQILLDKTVASAWPSFALYELRNPLTSPSTATETEVEAEPSPTQIQWLIIETYVNAPPTEASVPSSPTKGGKVKRSSSQRSDKRRPFGFFASSSSLAGKDVKDDKTAKRKDHVRRASEISTDSFGVKHKDPSKSQVDVSAQPAAIAEEPEPTTPIPPIAEEAAKDTTTAAPEEETAPKDPTEAVSEADQEVPAPAPAAAVPLTIPTTEGSRFVEGSSPGTIPEAVTDSGDHDKRDSKSVVTDTAAILIGTAATSAAIKHEDADDVDVPAPVSESQQHETAVMEPTSDAPHVSDALAQHGEESVPVNETIESSVPPPVEAAEQAALESQTAPDAVHPDVVNEGEQLVEGAQSEEAPVAALDDASHAGDEEEKARLAEEEERAHQLELERISKEQELQQQAEAQRLQEEEAARLAEQEQQRLAEEQAAAAEAQRLQAEAEELQRQQEEALRKAAEEKARQEELEAEIQRQKEAEEAARQKEEEDRLEQLRLEEVAKQEEARKAAEIQRQQEEEAARLAELERQRLLEEQAAAAEAQRLQAEAEELKRQEEEALRKAAEEKARQEELEAELQRQKEAEEAARQKEEEERLEKLRLEEIAKKEEEERLEKLRLEEIARKEEEERLEKLRLEELARQEEEERKAAELKRLQEEEAERIAELERQRVLAEQAAAAEAQRLQAEAEELKRQEEEALRKAAEEKARQEEIEAELQRQREAEEAARQKEEEERLEKLRLEEIAKREEEERKAAELQRLQEEEAARIAELERQRLLEEQAAAAEAQRLQAEAEELKRQEEEALRKAAEEKARQEELEAELQRQREAEEAAARQREEEERLEKLRLEEIARKEEEERLEKLRLEEIAKKEEEERLEKQRLEEIAKKEEEERLEKLRLEELAKKEEEERLEKLRLEELAKREEEERLEKLRLEEVAKKEEEERLEKLRLEEIAKKEEEERLEKLRLEEIAKKEEEERLEQERLAEIAKREEEERLEKERLEQIARQEEEEKKAAELKRLQEEEEERIRLEKEKAEEEGRLRKEEEERQRKEEEELERKKAEEAQLAAEAAAAEQAHQAEPEHPDHVDEGALAKDEADVHEEPIHEAPVEHEAEKSPVVEDTAEHVESAVDEPVESHPAQVLEPESTQAAVEGSEAPPASAPEEHPAEPPKETVAADAPPAKDEDDSEEEILVHPVPHSNAEN